MQYIKDHMGKFIGTQSKNGNTTITRDFKSGNIVASYNHSSNKTIDWKSNKFVNGNQSTRFLK